MDVIAREVACWKCRGSGVVADEHKRCVRCPLCHDGRLKVVPASQLAGAVGDATNLAVAAKLAVKLLRRDDPEIAAALAGLDGAITAHDRLTRGH